MISKLSSEKKSGIELLSHSQICSTIVAGPLINRVRDGNVSYKPAMDMELTRLVGPTLYCPCGCGVMQKEVLAQFIFGNPDNMAKVNAIVHPRVKEDFHQWADAQKGKDFCILESAILFESGFDSEVDFKVCVYAPVELRIQRCIKRDNTTREAVIGRINSQMDQAEKCRKADFVIVNDDAQALKPQISALIDKCKNTFKQYD